MYVAEMRMSKQYLGLGDYHLLRYRGIERYLCLVLIAHLLLTHLALDAPDLKAKLKARGDLRLPSVLQLQQDLRHQLRQPIPHPGHSAGASPRPVRMTLTAR